MEGKAGKGAARMQKRTRKQATDAFKAKTNVRNGRTQDRRIQDGRCRQEIRPVGRTAQQAR